MARTFLELFNLVVSSSIMASLLIGLILAFKHLFRDKLEARWHYYIWFLLIVRLALPTLPASFFSLYNLLPAKLIAPSGAVSLSLGSEANLTSNSQPDGLPAEWAPAGGPGQDAAPVSQITPGEPSRPVQSEGVGLILFGVWLAGAALMAIRITTIQCNFYAKMKLARPVGNSLIHEVFADCKKQMGVRRDVTLLETDALHSPVLYGVVRPRLLVPADLARKLNTEQLRHVFLHELAHLKRHDVALNLLTTGLQVVHWFNPIISYGFYRMQEDQELSCDALVLARLQPERIREYGQTIISLLELTSQPPQLPGLVGISGSKSLNPRRITMVTLWKKRSLKWTVIGLLTAVIVSVVALTNARAGGAWLWPTGASQPSAASTKGSSGGGAKLGADNGAVPGKDKSGSVQSPQEAALVSPADLQRVIAVEVRGPSGGQKTTTDQALVENVKSALARAKYVPDNGSAPGGQGERYDVILKLQGDPQNGGRSSEGKGEYGQDVLLSYYPSDGGSSYLRNQQSAGWWVVDGFDTIMKPLLPPHYLSLDQVLEIGQRLDPGAKWWPRYVAKGDLAVNGDLVWLLDGVTKTGERLAIYLDPVTGKELKRNPPESTAGAMEAVKEFYRLAAGGDYQAAQKLVHPDAVAAEFDLKPGQPVLSQVESAAWWIDGWKSPVTMQRLFDVVSVKVKLTDGTERNIIVAKDRAGDWRLISSRGQ
ncbi:MAG: hypothetical protein M1299_09370 [Firmicutes bacterium]|nr:hypothetical protein [Bacillota bacterium]